MKNLCKDMELAGFTNPDTNEAIVFCNHCPYLKCLLYETYNPVSARRRVLALTILKNKSDAEVANELGVNVKTIQRYRK